MKAHLLLDDDLARYLNEEARQEHPTLDMVLNHLLRPVVPGNAEGEPVQTLALTGKPKVSLVA